jgi:hypothetical protein
MAAGPQALWSIPNHQGGRQICLPTQASPYYGYPPIFHILLLEPVRNDPLLGQVTCTPGHVIVEGKPEYEVEEVLDSHVMAQYPQVYDL